MVVSNEFVIKRGPEHSTLAEYIADNPHPPCPIVGLDYVTEFWPQAGVTARPAYHCSLQECYNEQGNSRQMMQHLIRQYHVECWAREKVKPGQAVPDNMQGLVTLCKNLTGGKEVDLQSMKVILNKDLWEKCKKAKLRLNKQEADALFKENKNARNKISKNKAVLSTQTSSTHDDPVMAALRAAKKTAPRDKEQQSSKASSCSVKSNNPQKPGNISSKSKSSLSKLPSVGMVTPVIVTATLPDPVPSTATSNTMTMSSTISELCSISPRNELYEESNTTPSHEEATSSGSTETLPKSSSEVSLSNLNLCDASNPVSSRLVLDKNIESIVSSDKSSEKLPELIPDEKSKEMPGDDKDDTTPPQTTEQTKKLSLKEYQEKQKKQRQISEPPHTEEEDVKPFKNDDEVEVIGIKQGYPKASRAGTVEPAFKKEKPSDGEPRDLLDRRSSGDVVVENTVKAPPTDPIYRFKEKVTRLVKDHLFNYFAGTDGKERKKKNGELKEIKINSEKEFIDYCRHYSKKFHREIMDAYMAINGSTDGIENEDVKQYNIGFEIDKYFSEK